MLPGGDDALWQAVLAQALLLAAEYGGHLGGQVACGSRRDLPGLLLDRRAHGLPFGWPGLTPRSARVETQIGLLSPFSHIWIGLSSPVT